MRWTPQLGHAVVRRAAARPTRPAAGQSGFTLMEIIVSVMLVSIVVLGIAAGFLGLVRTNRMTQEQQAVDHAVTNFSESLKAAEYQPCGTMPAYNSVAGLWVSDRGVDVEVIDVDYWDESTASFVDTCSTDGGSQRLTVRAEWPGRDRDRQGQIVIRSR